MKRTKAHDCGASLTGSLSADGCSNITQFAPVCTLPPLLPKTPFATWVESRRAMAGDKMLGLHLLAAVALLLHPPAR